MQIKENLIPNSKTINKKLSMLVTWDRKALSQVLSNRHGSKINNTPYSGASIKLNARRNWGGCKAKDRKCIT